jgi:hypothetical protein
MDSCAVLKSDAARLACFDRELELRKRLSPGRVCTVPAPPPPVAATAPAPAATPVPPLPPAPAVRPPPPQPLSAQVVAIRTESPGIVAITLDNGEIWEQLETLQGFRVVLHHGVTIKPGLFGAFLLTTDERMTIRVRRIR